MYVYISLYMYVSLYPNMCHNSSTKMSLKSMNIFLYIVFQNEIHLFFCMYILELIYVK